MTEQGDTVSRQIKDESGYTMELINYKNTGLYIPAYNRVISTIKIDLDAIRNWKCRENDVFICATPKAGTHWLWELVSMLKRGTAERIISPKEIFMLELITKVIFEGMSGDRVFNTHLPFHYLPENITKKNAKIIYMLRNPKDTAVSHYYHSHKLGQYDGDWSAWFKRWLRGEVHYSSWFDYQIQWEKDIKNHPNYSIHIVHYEDMKEDPLRECKKIAEFIGSNTESSFLENVVELCDFKKMKAEKFDTAVQSKFKWSKFRKGKL
ncbi:hypothetical protein ScPMuIL_005313 [Solemya velum]